jgi:dienelactone hydrolase
MRLLTIISIIAFVSACSSEEEAPVNHPQAPRWTSGYPQVDIGASTADLRLKTETSAEVYYVLSDRPLNFTSGELQHTAEFPDTSAIKFSGKIELSAGEEFTKSLTLLQENHDYFTYFVLRNTSGNVLSEINSTNLRTESRQDTLTFHSTSENRAVNYLIYRPEESWKHPEKDYPVCFSFGDKNSIGSDVKPVNLIRDGSIAEYIYHRNEVPMIVISIQSVTTNWNLDLIQEGIDHVVANYPVDEERIYLTGYGEGGIASWNYAIAHPEQIAAIVPVSGKGDLQGACNLSGVDVWAFHNDTDDIIASANTRKMVSAISKCPPQRELSEIYFPDPGHNCWKRVYNAAHPDWSKSPGIDRMNIYNWMLSKSRP